MRGRQDARPNMAAPLLEVEDLHTQFSTARGIVRAVEGVSFTVNRGEVVAIVGESGSGKSVTALSIMRLLPRLTAKIPKGSVKFDGRSLLDLNDEQMREIRGRDISMIFQEPMTSLNPILTIGLQIMEPLQIHLKMTDEAGTSARNRAVAARRHHRSGTAAQTVPASVLRRHAPARDDRDRARLQSQAHHRRRTHHRARRHHPGADSRADEESVAQAQHRAHHHHPQSRGGRPLRRPRHRHVCRPRGRAGLSRRGVPSPAPSLHHGLAALGAPSRPAARRQARNHRRPAAKSAQPYRPAAASRRGARIASQFATRSRRCFTPTPAACRAVIGTKRSPPARSPGWRPAAPAMSPLPIPRRRCSRCAT